MPWPRGWWRPLAVYGAIALGALALVGLRDPALLALALLMTAPLVLFVLARSYVPPSLFLGGLRKGGRHVEIVRDEITWSGDRRVLARTPEGDWRVECHAGNAIHLRVRGPGMARIREVKGSPTKAGRAAVAGTIPRELLRAPFG